MLKLRGVCRDFQVGEETVHALDHVDLDVGDGEYISIMGPSGSGKSTLLNIIGLLDRPDAGSYELNGEDVAGLGDDALALHRQRNIGFIFQFFHLVPRLTAIENVELPLLLAGAAAKERRERARAALESVGLSGRLGHHGPTNSPAASGSASRLHARSSPSRTCCLPTSRRATSTRKPVPKSSKSSRGSTSKALACWSLRTIRTIGKRARRHLSSCTTVTSSATKHDEDRRRHVTARCPGSAALSPAEPACY